METNVIKWTGADLLSSYRFWGLACFLLFILITPALSSYHMPFFMSENGYAPRELDLMYFFRSLGMCFAIIPAWFISRSRSIYSLYVLGLIILISNLAFLFHLPFWIVLIANFLMGMVPSIVSLVILAFIAQATRCVECVIFLFGTIMGLFILFVRFFSLWPKEIINQLPSSFVVASIICFVGILFILPINKKLFTEAPRLRYVESSHVSFQGPMISFLSAFVPFYAIFWLIRVHQDIRHYSQSATLLTPFAAGWTALLVPFAIPFMLMSLNDVIQQHIKLSKSRIWFTFLFSFIFPPISLAMTQSALNQLLEDNALVCDAE